mmetsp:Transcript_55468/g.142836  ORF Transcript_55468/g.142836 Transcript_55468/m.142836 type:complete len:243 (+) Transcript_55468:574-1302(+)
MTTKSKQARGSGQHQRPDDDKVDQRGLSTHGISRRLRHLFTGAQVSLRSANALGGGAESGGLGNGRHHTAAIGVAGKRCHLRRALHQLLAQGLVLRRLAIHEQDLEHEARMAVLGLAHCLTTKGVGDLLPVQTLAMLEDGYKHVAAEAMPAQLRDVARQDLTHQEGNVCISCVPVLKEPAEDAAAREVARCLHSAAGELAAHEGNRRGREQPDHALEHKVGLERPGSCLHRAPQLFCHAGLH